MPSLRSRAFRLIIRHQTRRATKHATLRERRAAVERSAQRLPMPRDVGVEKTAIGDIPAEWIRPADSAADRALLYIHGGGYTMGSCSTHRTLAARIVSVSGAPTLLPEYRLAPEFPFPAALSDCLAAYQSLVDRGIAPKKIVIVGDSAGGGLALALAVTLRDGGPPLPAAIVCLSPWADLELTGESLSTRAKVDPICSLAECRVQAQHYAGENDPREPRISPVHADLHGLPPLLIHVGDREILLSDSIRLAERARDNGVAVELKVWEGMWHVWHMLAAYVPEGQRAIDEVGDFIRRQLE